MLIRSAIWVGVLVCAVGASTGCKAIHNYLEGPDSERKNRVSPTESLVPVEETAQASTDQAAPADVAPRSIAPPLEPTATPAKPPVASTAPAPLPPVQTKPTATPSEPKPRPKSINTAASKALPAPSAPAKTVPVRPAPAAKRVEALTAETLHVVYFDSDASVLSLRNRRLLEENAAWILKHPEVNVVIEGHTDSSASSEYNQALGAQRAQTASLYLQSLGVAADRIETVSYGEERPVDPTDTRAARAKNRRVQFLVYQRETTP